MMRWQKENTINAAALGTISEEEQVGRIIIGEFCNIDRPEYTEAYQKIIDKCAGEGSK